ncbi:MAG: DUF998 domain-containing protein [Anaerolineaceae bacterium]
MFDFLKDPLTFQILILTGSLSVLLGCTLAASAYRGRAGERFSPFNHYISELGERGVSRLAGLFNAGLIVCGLCLLPAAISLGLLIPGIWAKLGMLTGMAAAVSVALVGVFPVNRLAEHLKAAINYFRLALLMIVFFTLAIALPANHPPAAHPLYSLAGFPAILASSLFLTYPRVTENLAQNSRENPDIVRPRIWAPAVAEWAIFLTTLAWFVLIAFGL